MHFTFQYWFEWRHKCRKKATNARRMRSGSEGGTNRCIPLNDLEVRVLELSGKGSVAAADSSSNDVDNFLAEDSDSEPLENLKGRSGSSSEKMRRSVICAPRSPIGKNNNVMKVSNITCLKKYNISACCMFQMITIVCLHHLNGR